MKQRFLKLLFKLFIFLSLLECIYLFVLPSVLQNILNKDFISYYLEKNTNIVLKADKLTVQTLIKPSIKISAKNISLKNKTTMSPLVSADTLDFETELLPLIFKTAIPKHFYSDNLQINIEQNKDGSFNFENLIPLKGKNSFKIKYKNSEIRTSGAININNKKSDFEIDITCSLPYITKENLSKINIDGSAFLYNLNLKDYFPLLNKLNPEIKNTEGIIEFIQISSEKQNSNIIKTVINAKFKDIVYDMKNWKNFISAAGENKINSTVELYDSIIKINHFNYIADKIDITADGKINIENKPDLDLDISVKNSRTENIASLLPPTLVKETMIIEKIKKYGIYGDINGNVHLKGRIPQPDITGWAKGRNIHILDKAAQKLHKGTVDITFDKRKLYMDILLEMANKQTAKINGTTYMFRDGVNDVTIKTTNNLDFSLAHKIVMPISDAFMFQLGPLPDMIIKSGKGQLDIHIKGSLDFINLDGYCRFDNVNLTYNGLFGEITSAKGRLDFKGDNIIIKSERGFIQNNPFSVDGIVKINNNLNFNLSSNNARANDLLEIINKSELLKDVKKGLALFKSAKGKTVLHTNITANIVPVPFGQPPLPPEEAFTDMKVKGFVNLNDVLCFLEGFKIPIEKIKGKVNFTETVTDFKDIYAQSGSSNVKIDGKIITDLETKIPDVELTIKSNSIKTGDTIKFLSESYMYPKNYPDISSLYNLETKHDLYLTYKAKSIDFLPGKVYAVMNMLKSSEGSVINAESGRIILDKANVNVDNINFKIFNSNINISGGVKNVDTNNPVYDIAIKSPEFNLEALNYSNEINIIPKQIIDILKNFSKYQGYMSFEAKFKKNILNAIADIKGFSFVHSVSSMPVNTEDFSIKISDDKMILKNLAVNLAKMPLFANITLSKIYTNPYLDGYITTKLDNDFIQRFLPKSISDKIAFWGDINASSKIKGTVDNFELKPKITLYPDSYVVLSGVKIADSAEKRIFESDISFTKNKINVKNVDYYKYITTRNNTVYPAKFAYGNGILEWNNKTLMYEPALIYMKTEKSISAKLLNIFMNKPFFKQGTVNCDLKYQDNMLQGEMDAKNIDIPIADTVIKNIKLNTEKEHINIKLFGFINDSIIRADSILDNDLKKLPHIDKLKLHADKIDINKLLSSIDNVRSEFNMQKSKNNSPDLSMFEIENGELNIDELTVKNYKAEQVNGKFSINKDGIFNIKDINIKLGEGSAKGEIVYDLKNTNLSADLAFNNVDSNYLAENLFDAKNQIYGIANANFVVKTNGNSDEELIKNLSGFAYFDMTEGKMPKLGSLEYLLRASNIVKGGITGFSLNNVLELLNLVKTGYFSSIQGNCILENGSAKNIEILSKGENLSLYIHGDYNIPTSSANMEILGKLSDKISTVFGPIGNASLNTFFKHIPGVSLLDFDKKDFIENVEKIPSFTGGEYDSRIFQAIIKGDINSSGYVQSFKWVK